MMRTSDAPTLRGDVVGGITTFLTMAYIVVVNPTILATPGTGLPFDGVLGATVLLTVVMTLAMGLYARLPFGVAPGMGLNAFLAFTVILQHKVPWPVALGCVFWAGAIFVLLSLTPLRERVATAIPTNLRLAAAAGIGLLLAFIGLRNAGIIVADPATLVRVGPLDHRAGLLVLGLAIAALLIRHRSPLAFLASIAGVTLAAWALGDVTRPPSVVSVPAMDTVWLRLDVVGALQWTLLPTMLSIAFTDLFDSLSTFVGVSIASGLVDENGRPHRLREGLIVDAWATLGAALVGSSPGTAYVESIAGIRMGARTGRAAVVTAVCFIPCFFLAPLAGAVPAYATAPVLILVGAAMFGTVRDLTVGTLEDSVPPFVTLFLIPLTLSITQGILWGFVLHALLYALAGRAREVSVPLWIIAALAVVLLVLERVL